MVAKPLRIALGALIIKERCGFNDRETVEQITENPYLQYFIGLEKYHIEPPFDPSLMVYFRKRLDQKIMKNMSYALAGYLWITCYNKGSGKNIITLNIALDEKINNKAHAGDHSHEDNVEFYGGGGG